MNNIITFGVADDEQFVHDMFTDIVAKMEEQIDIKCKIEHFYNMFISIQLQFIINEYVHIFILLFFDLSLKLSRNCFFKKNLEISRSLSHLKIIIYLTYELSNYGICYLQL